MSILLRLTFQHRVGFSTCPLTQNKENGTRTVLEVKLPSSESHTVGGMVISHLRHLPISLESVIQAGYSIRLEEMSDRVIQKFRVGRAG